MNSKHKGYLYIGLLWLVSLIIYILASRLPEQSVRQLVQDAGLFGPLLLIFLIWLTNIIAPLSATPFLFAGFFLYGSTVVIFSYIAAFIASITNFWIARIWGRGLVEKLAGSDSLRRIDRLTKDYGYQTLFITRIMLGSYYDVISYIFGLTPMKFKPYLVISTLGTIPGSLLWYFLSTKVNNPLTFTIITIGFAWIFLALYMTWFKFFRKTK